MRRGSSRSVGVLLLLLLAGVIIGSVAGNILAAYFNIPLFTQSLQVGTQDKPLILNLQVIELVLGFTITVNFGTILGILLGIIFYFKS